MREISRVASAQLPWWPVVALGALAIVTLRRPAPETELLARLPARPASAAAPTPAAAAGAPGAVAFAKRLYTSLNDNRLIAVAAGVTFYAILALFPAIGAFVSLYGLVADPATIGQQIGAMSGLLPEGALSIIGEQVKHIASTPNGSLSIALATSVAISLWSANAGMKAVFDALNVAYERKETRSFIALNLRSLAFTFGAIVLLMAMVASVVIIPIVFNIIGFASIAATLVAVARWPLMLAILVGALMLLYRYGPDGQPSGWRHIMWGSAVAAVLWIVVSLGFSFYVAKFGSYNATYGSLGAAIGFMTWIWISGIVILLGAEISAELDKSTSAAASA